MDNRKRLSEQLKNAIRASGKSLCQIERDTGISKSALSRFLNGERGVSTSVLDVLGEYLGLRIVRDETTTKTEGE